MKRKFHGDCYYLKVTSTVTYLLVVTCSVLRWRTKTPIGQLCREEEEQRHPTREEEPASGID